MEVIRILTWSAIALMMTSLGCSRESPTVVFMIPKGFTGLLMLTEDRSSGIPLRYSKEGYVVEVPDSGRMAIKDFKVFFGWHKEIAIHKNGTALKVTNTEPGFYSLPYLPHKGMYWFVGSQQDYDIISRTYDFEKLPLATKIDTSELRKRTKP